MNTLTASIADVLTNLTTYLHTILQGNEFAIGLITTGIFGYLLYFSKVTPLIILNFVKKHFTTSLEVSSEHEAYFNIIKQLQSYNINNTTRVIKLLNGMWGGDADTIKAIGYGSQLFFLDKTLVKLSITKVEGTTHRVVDILTLTKLGRSHAFFNTLIAKLGSKDISTDHTSYYKSDNGHLRFITKQPRRKLNTIFLEKELKEKLTNTLTSFVSKADFYHKHGIPYQMGILLYGPPGTGKTALIKAIADMLNMSITIAETVSDFTEACSTVKNSIIVAEEIDTFGVSKRSSSVGSLEETIEDTTAVFNKEESETQKLMSVYGDDYAKYTLGKLLTSIDGLINNDGRIIIMTTNKPVTLDEALTRPGRIDLQLEVGFMTTITFSEMLSVFFPTYAVPTSFKLTSNVSASTIQNEILIGSTPEKIIEQFKSTKGN